MPNSSLDRVAKHRKLTIGSVVKPWGKIGMMLITAGEPYYMLVGKGGAVALLPAKMVQHHADNNPMSGTPLNENKYVVKEGVEGYYHYHLAQPHKYVSLCGARVMKTLIPTSAWGTVSHLKERWCADCKLKAIP